MSTAVQPAASPFVPSPSQLAMAYSVCRGIARTQAKNFYYAFLALPRRKREALSAVYAFMRRCDDLSDDPSTLLDERRARLLAWLHALHRAQSGYPTDDPVLLALMDTQRRYNIPGELLDQLAFGTLMDVSAVAPGEAGFAVEYRTFEELYGYCYRVAAVVGLVCIKIFGYRNPAAEGLAERTGIAFQLTNIIRDVKEDAAMGRIYLPQEELQRFQLSAAELQGNPDRARLRSLLAAQADRAREFYRSAQELIPMVDEDSQPSLWVLVTIYQRLLEKIASRQYDVYRQKISLTFREKLTVLGKGLLDRLL